ncbi:14588_t:CDS:2, partial [Gigaspora margarita]
NGYRQHFCNAIKKLMCRSDLDEIPVRTLHEFKNILIQQTYRQLPLSFAKMEEKCVLMQISWRVYIFNFSTNLEGPKWGQKNYDQNQQTYIILEQLLNHKLYTNNNNDQNNDIGPLVQLNNQKKKKKPKIFH